MLQVCGTFRRGRKRDAKECQCLLKLHAFGLLNNSFQLSDEIRVARTLWRRRGDLVTEAGSAHAEGVDRDERNATGKLLHSNKNTLGSQPCRFALELNRSSTDFPLCYKVCGIRFAERPRDLIRQIREAREVVIIRVSPDHVHLPLSAPPILSPAKLAQHIKGRSSRFPQAEFPELRKRHRGQHMWARGYFCATAGAVDEAAIRAYIESQKWDEDDQGFKITAPTES